MTNIVLGSSVTIDATLASGVTAMNDEEKQRQEKPGKFSDSATLPLKVLLEIKKVVPMMRCERFQTTSTDDKQDSKNFVYVFIQHTTMYIQQVDVE